MTQANLPASASDRYRGWAISSLLALDVFVNCFFLFGRFPETISGRLGRSMANGLWASRVPWPRWWVEHCYWSAGLPLPE